MTFTGVVSAVLVAGGFLQSGMIGEASAHVDGQYTANNHLSSGYSSGSVIKGLSLIGGYSPRIGAVDLGSVGTGGTTRPFLTCGMIGVPTQWVAGSFSGGPFVKSGTLDPTTQVSLYQMASGVVFQTTPLRPPFSKPTMTFKWG